MTILSAKITTRWCRAWCIAIPTGCCSWSPAPVPPIAATAPARGWWAIRAANISFPRSQWERALAYLEAHTEVRDVLLSGGDPLTLSDDKLDWLLGRLRAIKHIEFLRIGSKMPVVTAAAGDTQPGAGAEKASSAMDEPAFHPPQGADPRSSRSHRPAGRCRHSPGQPDRAAEGYQRHARSHDPADAWPAEEPGDGLIIFTRPIPSAVRRISAPEWTRGWRSSPPCAATPRAMPRRFSASMRRAAAARSSWRPIRWRGVTAIILLLKNFEGKVYRYPDPAGMLGR